MTFCVTCVVERTLYTHFRNWSYGFANDCNLGTGALIGHEWIASAFLRSSIDWNQNKQVIYKGSV